ncbi:two-component sensor histidine kinase [Microcoleus sp. FACHB-1515]|uniref:two-component system sensor histidine kinase RppB n=1 Tax=Cyanophyceae TaxID=3028117 RepID=UPI001683F8F4|nr:two-component system sensor histidine kinase RppB [Microcoleus sp. FACHB-1515]MBD2093284.1 two-component sensor histidine kinase [Microcoleus sp. FACHB-1515]
MNRHQLFRRSRIRFALGYALVMGLILCLFGLGMSRSLVQSNWAAMERELESIAGTLHDSLEPRLPATADPTTVLRQILPELCLAGQACPDRATWIERHTLGISDRSTYYIRLFDHQGKLLAFSPHPALPLPNAFDPAPWQTRTAEGIRYHQFTTILHPAHTHPVSPQSHAHASWGYLQIGRTLESFDAQVNRMKWILIVGFLIALSFIAISSWWLSGLAMRPIYQSYQQQQQFTADAAHELRSPLAALLATVEAILRMPRQGTAIQPMLHTIDRQGRRLSHLIADLLLLSSLEDNAAAKPVHLCCLNDLISDLSEEFLELATRAEIHLMHQSPDRAILVAGNESQLYRLVSNLIANAIHYTPSGGQVRICLTARDRMALITVQDTGVGIAPDQHTRIFDRFYRVDGDRSRQTGGAGLGLAMAQAIAQAHQGKIQVQSDMGKGSVFTVHLPLNSALAQHSGTQ